jgi:hypothetical protein
MCAVVHSCLHLRDDSHYSNKTKQAAFITATTTTAAVTTSPLLITAYIAQLKAVSAT